MRDNKQFRVEIRADGTLRRFGDLATAHRHALTQARVDLRSAANTMLSEASNRNQKLPDSEAATVDAILKEVIEIEQAIVLAENEADIERTSSTLSLPATQRSKGRRFAEMFAGVPLDRGGFASAEEFLAVLHSGLADPRLVADYGGAERLNATSTIGDPVSGGFSVPTQMFARWLDLSLESEVVRPRADIRPMTSSSAVAAAFDDYDHSSSLYGGFSGTWMAEAGSMTPQTPKLRLIELSAKKLALLVSVSNELIADGVGFEEQLGQAIVKALSWFLDKAFLSGDGSGKPMGILNAPCTISVAKETNQAAATIQYPNIVKMFARLSPDSFDNAIWIVNQSAIPQLLQTSISVGVGGSFVPLLVKGASGGWEMMTRPVVFTEKVPTLGTKGDVMLCDLRQYVVGIRADFSLAKSQHVGFASDTSSYRGIIRVDGMPKISTPTTPANGNTVSPFVVLATRA